MSLIGIDIGSSSVKIGAYREDDGALIALTGIKVTPLHPQPGWWEQDPEEIWTATSEGIRTLMADATMQHDLPKAIALSVSGRENFLADAKGNPLTNGVMGADLRGGEFEHPLESTSHPEPWTLSCGHLRERMDPVFRYLWWAKHHPEQVDKARYFLGWQDFLALRMTGRAATDSSQAGRWATWDLLTRDWADERVTQFGIPQSILPEVLLWGTVVGEIKPALAAEWGLPQGTILANGSMDLNCSALGIGVTELGDACLVSGSYENMLIPTSKPPSASMLLRGLSVTPHPCSTGLSLYAICPTGNAVLNWAREQYKLTIEEVESQVTSLPSPVTAVPYLSGAMLYWEDGRKARGTLLGMTLATTGTQIVQAFMEGIAYDHVNTLALLTQEGVNVTRLRATGGGTRSRWWTQLKADVTNVPIEVVDQPEPGTLGAALLAGKAIGVIDDVNRAARLFAKTNATYEPNTARAALHAERIADYHHTIEILLREIY
jgi:xylulokinase